MPTPPNDIYWHMRQGQQIVETRQIPSTNQFAWGVPPETPYFHGGWLADVLMYGMYQLGGVELLVFARNLLAGTLLGLVTLESYRRNRSWQYVSFAVILAGALLLSSVNVRDQIFAWVPFGLTMVLLGRYVDGRLGTGVLVGALAGVMAFWVNVHGSFVLGFALVGGVLAGEAVERLRERADGEGRGWSRDRLGGLGLALAAMALASLANPVGPGIYRYVSDMARSPVVQRIISEFQPPRPEGLVFGVFYLSILALIVVSAFRREPIALRDLVLVCGFLWLAWTSARHIPWYGVVAMPVLAEGLARLRPVAHASATTRVPRWGAGLLAALLVLPVVLLQPWFGRTSALQVHTPIAATEYLRAHPDGRLFNEVGYGSYLIWALSAEPVFVDPRLEMFPESVWEEYIAISTGRDSVNLLARRGVDRVILRRDSQARLSEALAGAGTWQQEYRDAESEIWRRLPGT
jgi:hypothetical protein